MAQEHKNLILDEFAKRNLYGGAITVDLPTSFFDSSQIRQIPDHQECYLERNGETYSIIFEILAFENPDGTEEEAFQTHFEDLFVETGDSTQVLQDDRAVMPKLSGYPVMTRSFVSRPTTPTNDPSGNPLQFTFHHLMLLRLRDASTDIMITINLPHYKDRYDVVPESEVTMSGMAETWLMRGSEVIKQKIIESFEIKDWTLFDGPEDGHDVGEAA